MLGPISLVPALLLITDFFFLIPVEVMVHLYLRFAITSLKKSEAEQNLNAKQFLMIQCISKRDNTLA